MNVLALDTATEACSVALYRADQPLIAVFEICPAQHTEKLLAQLNTVLETAGLVLQDMDAIAFGQGPGSFTGLRIASGLAQGLGVGLGKPLLPVSTLRAIAQAAFRQGGHRQVAVRQDARLGAQYCGLYRLNADQIMVAVQPDWLEPHQDLPLDPAWTLVSGQYPHARDIAQIAAYAHQQGEVVMPAEAIPVYLRDQVV